MKIIIPLGKELLVSEANLTHQHWTTRNARHAEQKKEVKKYLLTFFSRDIVFPIVIRLTRIAPRRLDSDNLSSSFKWIRDSIADYFLGEKFSKKGKKLYGRNDDNPNIVWEYDQRKGEPKEYALELDIKTKIPFEGKTTC